MYLWKTRIEKALCVEKGFDMIVTVHVVPILDNVAYAIIDTL